MYTYTDLDTHHALVLVMYVICAKTVMFRQDI